MSLFGPNIGKLEKKGDIDGLMLALRSNKIKTRYEAALALERLNWKPRDEAVKAWYLASKGEWQVLRKLCEFAIPPLILGMQDKNENLRRECGAVLAQITLSNTQKTVPLLCEILQKELLTDISTFSQGKTEARNYVVKILGEAGDPRAAVPLVQSVQKILDLSIKYQPVGTPKNPYSQYYSDHYQLVKLMIQKIGEPVEIPLYEALVSDDPVYKDSKSLLASMLAMSGPTAASPLLQAVGSEDINVRRAAVNALAFFDDSQVIDCLVSILRDKVVVIRKSAAWGLSNKRWEPSNQEDLTYFLLARLMSSNTLNGYFSSELTTSIVALGPAAVTPLINSLNIEGSLLYKQPFGDPRFFPARNIVSRLLFKMGRGVIPALQQGLGHPDQTIRQEVQALLKRFK